MKRALSLLLLLILGVAIGGGAGYGAVLLFAKPGGSEPKAAATPAAEPPRSFVSSAKILAPLVFSDGRLAGYVNFDVSLEVESDKADMVTSKLPLMLHAINMRTWRTPLATGPDGLLANIGGFRDVVRAASTEAFGEGTVKRIAITRAEPA